MPRPIRPLDALHEVEVIHGPSLAGRRRRQGDPPLESGQGEVGMEGLRVEGDACDAEGLAEVRDEGVQGKARGHVQEQDLGTMAAGEGAHVGGGQPETLMPGGHLPPANRSDLAQLRRHLSQEGHGEVEVERMTLAGQALTSHPGPKAAFGRRRQGQGEEEAHGVGFRRARTSPANRR